MLFIKNFSRFFAFPLAVFPLAFVAIAPSMAGAVSTANEVSASNPSPTSNSIVLNTPQASSDPSSSSLLLAQATTRPRIAVLDFDFTPTVGSYLSAFPGYAEGVSVVLVDRLVNSGNFTVIERSQIEAVLREQNLGASGRVDASTAAQIGRILGVEAVIIGSITQFDYDVQDRGVRVFGVGTRREVVEAQVRLNARMVNTSTAEIIRTAEGVGVSEDSAESVAVGGIFGQDSDTDDVRRVLSAATEIAIDEIVESFNSSVGDVASLPPALPTQSAVIADIAGSTLILNRGTSQGYRSGMCLSVERVIREVVDPETQEVLRQVTETVGEIQLTDVDSGSSVGRLTSGSSATLNVGDVAKPVDCPN
ncbi:MAG: CsgG/HfaB family protein [Leptolyngbyaceae bacterium]|nr:CsgG/HfaB family protein [Leptolyngbyaceae bacterium]